MQDLNKVYWIKVVLGIVLGFILGILGIVGWLGVGIGLGMILPIYPITVYLFKVDPENVGGKRKLLTTGLLQYILIWLAVYTLIYTIIITL